MVIIFSIGYKGRSKYARAKCNGAFNKARAKNNFIIAA